MDKYTKHQLPKARFTSFFRTVNVEEDTPLSEVYRRTVSVNTASPFLGSSSLRNILWLAIDCINAFKHPLKRQKAMMRLQCPQSSKEFCERSGCTTTPLGTGSRAQMNISSVFSVSSISVLRSVLVSDPDFF